MRIKQFGTAVAVPNCFFTQERKTMTAEKLRRSILYMTQLAIYTAVVLVFQLGGIAIRLPFLSTPVSLVLMPIVLGAVTLGPRAGAWLGFVFGAEVLIVCGVMATDSFTATLFVDHPLLTALLCIGKGTAAGWLAGVVFRVLAGKGVLLALFAAAATAPVVNTGIFILGSYTMMDTFTSKFLGEGESMFYFLVIICAGLNFVFEFLFNLLLVPAMQRVMGAVRRYLPQGK